MDFFLFYKISFQKLLFIKYFLKIYFQLIKLKLKSLCHKTWTCLEIQTNTFEHLAQNHFLKH